MGIYSGKAKRRKKLTAAIKQGERGHLSPTESVASEGEDEAIPTAEEREHLLTWFLNFDF